MEGSLHCGVVEQVVQVAAPGVHPGLRCFPSAVSLQSHGIHCESALFYPILRRSNKTVHSSDGDNFSAGPVTPDFLLASFDR